mgnify:FL=1
MDKSKNSENSNHDFLLDKSTSLSFCYDLIISVSNFFISEKPALENKYSNVNSLLLFKKNHLSKLVSSLATHSTRTHSRIDNSAEDHNHKISIKKDEIANVVSIINFFCGFHTRISSLVNLVNSNLVKIHYVFTLENASLKEASQELYNFISFGKKYREYDDESTVFNFKNWTLMNYNEIFVFARRISNLFQKYMSQLVASLARLVTMNKNIETRKQEPDEYLRRRFKISVNNSPVPNIKQLNKNDSKDVNTLDENIAFRKQYG